MASTNRMQTNRGQDPDRRHGVYVISVAAEIAGVHPQTLRIYERKGLLDPARTVGGNRRYSEFDIDRLRRIAALKLEEELRALHGNIEQLRRDAKEAVDEVSRRHRRDLVPLSQSVVVWGSRPSIFDERR